MKLKRIKKRIITGATATAIAACMFLESAGISLASNGTWTAPETPITVDDNVITVAAKRAAQTLPEILGANIVATDNIGGCGNCIFPKISPFYQ